MLTVLGLTAGLFRSVVRFPLGLPSHSALQWLPVVILGQLWVRRPWAALYQSAMVGAVYCFYPGKLMLGFGALAPLSEFLLAGALCSWGLYRFAGYRPLTWQVWLICPLIGLAANLARWVYRLPCQWYRPAKGLYVYGLAGHMFFYLAFGLASGVLAALLYRGLAGRRRESKAPSN